MHLAVEKGFRDILLILLSHNMVSKVAVSKPRGTAKLEEIKNSVGKLPVDLPINDPKISSLFDKTADSAMQLAEREEGRGENRVVEFLRTCDGEEWEKLISSRAEGGKTLLMMAAENGWIKVTKHLLEKLSSDQAKHEVSVSDDLGDTCLHYAARCSAGKDYRTPILKMLVDKGADPEAENKAKQKPQEIALDTGGEDGRGLVAKIIRDISDARLAQNGNGRMVFTDLPKLNGGLKWHVFISHCQKTTKLTIQHIKEIYNRISPSLKMWWDQVRPTSARLPSFTSRRYSKLV